MNGESERKIKNYDENTKKTATTILLEFCDDSTIHGLRNISKKSNNTILRILWTMGWLGCFSYCIYLCYQLFTNFYSYPSFTKITTVNEIPTEFPMVTLCNGKLLNSSNPLTQEYLNNHPNIVFEEDANIQLVTDRNLTYETRRDMGFKIEDMLQECYFNLKYCAENDFVYFFDYYRGNCYSFNSGFYPNQTKRSIATVSSNYDSFSFTLTLYLGNPSADMYDSYYSGTYVTIQNQSIVPFSKGDIIKVAPKTSTNIFINRNFIKKLPAPYGNCLFDTSSSSTFSSKYFDYIVKTMGQAYANEYCYSLCIQDFTVKLCGCASYMYPVFNNSEISFCTNFTGGCMFDSVAANIGNFSKICTEACPIECNSIEYTYTSNNFVYSNNIYENLRLYNWTLERGLNISLEEIPDAFIEISIFYKNMHYTLTEQVAQMVPADLLSSFGGILGLFLGMSFLSFFEFFDVIWKLFELCLDLSMIKNRRRRIGSIFTIVPQSIRWSHNIHQRESLK